MSQKKVLMNLKLRYTLKDFEIKFKTQARREKELIDLHILLPTKMKVRLVPRKFEVSTGSKNYLPFPSDIILP